MNKVCVYGSGVQGSMLAFRCAIYDKHVTVYDLDPDALDRAREKMTIWSRERVSSGRASEHQMEAAPARIRLCEDAVEALADAEIVIENVPERLDLKQAVWSQIDDLAPQKALLTSNSSSLRSSEIGAHVLRKDRTFSVNFMTPTEDDLVEVMWNSETSDPTKAAALAFLRSIDCIPIVTKREIKGFSLNRVWRAVKKECLRLWAEDYVDPEDLDRAFMLEWNTTHGPFGLMDKVGLDVVRDIELSYFRESGDATDLPPRRLEQMVERGLLGEKSGAGFYSYPHPAYEKSDWLTAPRDEQEDR